MTLPNFIGIGAPKAGTTWLSNCLGEHPDVFMPPAKELVFFDYGDFDDRLADYESHFTDVRNETAIGEFTTRYLASERPAPRIKRMIPDVRLLVCLRNPAEQIYSHYWHLLRQNFHQPTVQKHLSFEEACERFPDLLKSPVRYWDQLQYWLKFFTPEQFLILIYDDIKTQPEAELARTFSFLGVDSSFLPPSTRERGTAVRQGTSPRSGLAQQIHAGVYTTLSRWVYQPLKEGLGVKRANQLKEALRIRPLMESVFFRKGYPKLNQSQREKLVRDYVDQVEGLEQMLKRKLDTWR
jgi:hypothetical protein